MRWRRPDDDGDGENVIEESSAQMINNIFEFKDLTAGDVMTHRTNIVGVDMSVSLDDIIYLALDMGFSRIPVYEGSIDRIVRHNHCEGSAVSGREKSG